MHPLRNLESLSVSNCPRLLQLGDLDKMSHLREVDFYDLDKLWGSEINKLSHLNKLESVSLTGDFPTIKNLNFLRGSLDSMRALRIINLKHLTDSGIGVFYSLSKLEKLHIKNCDGISNINTIAGMRKLEELELGSLPDLTFNGIQGLRHLSNLKRVEINRLKSKENAGKADDISFFEDIIENAAGLTYFEIHEDSLSPEVRKTLKAEADKITNKEGRKVDFVVAGYDDLDDMLDDLNELGI